MATLVALAMACDTARQPDRPIASFIETDSAGVRSIEVQAGAFDNLPVWELGEPLLRLGELDGDAPFLFGNSVQAPRLSDGSLVLLYPLREGGGL